jgi:adenylate cyclase
VARLKRERGVIADRHAEATVMFADIVGFTAMSSTMQPELLVRFLNSLFSELDALTTKLGLEKIKTIGDAYMVAAGLPLARPDHAHAIARLALEMRAVVGKIDVPDGRELKVRIGIHSGPVVAGVIGATKLTYDLWGDTVNIASRMESHAEPGMIQVTEATRNLLEGRFRLEDRGSIQVKGKGAMNAFVLVEELGIRS